LIWRSTFEAVDSRFSGVKTCIEGLIVTQLLLQD
jgi:hypothetical protein